MQDYSKLSVGRIMRCSATTREGLVLQRVISTLLVMIHNAGFHDNVRDGVTVLEYLTANFPAIDTSQIYLAGHSEGGWTISAMYPKLIEKNIKPKGMMFLCGFGTTMKQSILYQGEQCALSVRNMKGFKGWLFRLLGIGLLLKSKVEANIQYYLSTTADMVRVMLFSKMNAKWFRESLQYDPNPNWKLMDCDVLAISGSKDVQVPALDPEKDRNLVPNAASVTILNIKDMCHILKIQENEASILNVHSDYKRMAHEAQAPELVHAVEVFLSS
jgi:pimeloyl-ACP methyl ester carboxylesterase